MQWIDYLVKFEVSCDSVMGYSSIHGTLSYSPPGGKPKRVGGIKAYIFPLNYLGARAFDAFDCVDVDTSACYSMLEARGGLEEHETVIYLATADVDPAHRGKDLGHFMVRELIGAFRYGVSGLFVLQAKPLEVVKSARRKSKQGAKKLERYWRRLGFRQLSGNGYLCLEFTECFSEEAGAGSARTILAPQGVNAPE